MLHFKHLIFVLAIPLVLLGCSGNDDDPYCEDTFELVINISPENSGTVQKTIMERVEDWPQTVLTAVPNEGYAFKEWIRGDGETSTNNPYLINNCGTRGTVTLTVVFEQIEE